MLARPVSRLAATVTVGCPKEAIVGMQDGDQAILCVLFITRYQTIRDLFIFILISFFKAGANIEEKKTHNSAPKRHYPNRVKG